MKLGQGESLCDEAFSEPGSEWETLGTDCRVVHRIKEDPLSL